MRRLAALACTTLALAGCGLGPGEEREGGAELRITRDFGHERLASVREDGLREDQTIMRLLQSERDVETRYGGKFVQSIDGLAGGGSGGETDWFFFVNGIEGTKSAAEYELNPGDVVQWDHRDWRAAMQIPAIVGAWPEPFLHGLEGKRLPVRVECESEEAPACRTVKERLRDAGVPATGASLGTSPGERQSLLRVVVAKWPAARIVRAIALLEDEPQASGVFARYRGDDRLELLDEAGEPARDAPLGSGLIAMTGYEDEALVFSVTALDDEGLEAAANALDADSLSDAFALAVTPEGALKLPLREGE